MTADANHQVPPTRAGRPSRLMRVALASFVAGLIFVLVVFSMFALGHTDLPWWLSTAAIGCTSAGFGLGLIALLREARGR